MDFVKGKESVPVAAVINECRLQRRFYAGDFGEINVAAQELSGGRLEIKFLDPAITQDDRSRLSRGSAGLAV
jgi:hypothetical protein